MKAALMVLFFADALLENTFCLLYGLRSPWRQTQLGRMMFAYSATVAGIMDLAIVSMWWQPSPWVWLVGYGLFGASLLQRLILLIRAQQKG